MTQVSVIITAFNVERYIRATIRSVIEQSMSDIEIIVVNDGSTDGTRAIVESLCETDARLVLVNRENGGVSAARNRGLSCAHGEYILFVDGDDLLLPAACESMHRKATAEGADMVVSDFLAGNDDRSLDARHSGGEFTALRGDEFAHLLLRPFFRVAMWNKLIRRRLFAEGEVQFPVGISMGEDLVTLFELACRAQKVVKLDEPTIVYVIRAGSLVRTLSPRQNTITIAMDRLEELVQHFYGDDPHWRRELHAARYYYVLFSRVLNGHVYGGAHRELYSWYSERSLDEVGRGLIPFVHRHTAIERLLARGYQRGYAVGVALSWAINLARSMVSRVKIR